MACILGLDTSSEGCSAALIKDGQVTSVYEVVPRDHTRKIIPMIQQVLKDSDTKPEQLDAIAFGRGPGSFTGLRIAAGVTQGLAYGLDVKVIPVSTLEAMALEAFVLEGHQRVATAIDARMDEVYWGAFKVTESGVVALQSERVCKPEQVSLAEDDASDSSFAGVGSGWLFGKRMPEKVQTLVSIGDQALTAKAEYIVRIADSKYREANGVSDEIVSAEQAIPVYLRDTVTWKKLPGRE
ncbi:tRNA (adenosine(37)-N6)-threonylcarbamoyltransferase complex dimerization subunit type 1 TsaB [Alkalimarinus sediminis]|uniref:tRNA threonylcarbamoyladenosine biosynthesis protein TsaB n=1 Tax=Alkalimarinus sediminis TaxID=1632866 RepID=A0A9E8KQ93_9ALTE|nr:tRNA (adenosine(37)-N6)-threonylcarbamoyltransferase complex dimerization subunit type 1 TsaB [Alkalimarinus sediminis]UZW75559.1 tRNA (adenosine(37)-N6)-threonylcarbamoyltransferase complex dimerization subunit type 1 TsaB [Alkalimarinus sediminis]